MMAADPITAAEGRELDQQEMQAMEAIGDDDHGLALSSEAAPSHGAGTDGTESHQATSSISAFQAEIAPPEASSSVQRLREAYGDCMSTYGGPRQYLQAQFESNKAEFMHSLLDNFPPTEDVDLLLAAGAGMTLPAHLPHELDRAPPTKMHIVFFSFSSSSSLKGPPEALKSSRLAARMIEEGFMSSTDPIWVRPELEDNGPPVPRAKMGVCPPGPLPPAFSCAYIKGSTRITTMLALMGVAISEGLVDAFKSRWENASRINFFAVKHATKKGEAFANLDSSFRGSLRSAPNALEWCSILKNLIAMGYTMAGLIKEWNNGPGKSEGAVLNGGKSTCVKNLIEKCPQSAYDIMQAHVSRMTWSGCCFSEAALSSVKLYPGHCWRSSGSGVKVVVTEESLKLTFERCISEFECRFDAQKKWTKKEIEAWSEEAALLVALATKVNIPCCELLKSWSQGAIDICSEIKDALTGADIGSPLLPERVPSFKRILDMAQKPSQTPSLQESIAMEDLENAAFAVVTQQLLHDRNAALRLKQGLASSKHQTYWAKRSKFEAMHKAMSETVKALISKRSMLATPTTAQQSTNALDAFAKKVEEMAGIVHSELHLFGMVNWLAAPSSKSKQAMENAAAVAGRVVTNFGDKGIAGVLMPAFSRAGKLSWTAEQTAVQMLSKEKVCMDHHFYIPLTDKQDPRDARPMVVSGRLALPTETMTRKAGGWWHTSPWKAVPLLQSGRTLEAQMLPSQQMAKISPDGESDGEDEDPTDGPSGHNHHASTRAAQRWEQIGCDAYMKLLEATIEHISQGAMLVVDADAGVGELFEATLVKTLSGSQKVYYFGLTEKDFAGAIQERVLDNILGRVIGGGLKIPGVVPPTENLTPEEAIAQPQKPQLQVLQIDGDGVLSIPANVEKKWLGSQCATKWQEAKAELSKAVGYDVAVCDGTTTTTTAPQEAESAKRRKTDLSSRCKPIADLPASPLHTLNAFQKNLELRVFSTAQEPEVFLCNATEKDQTVKESAILAMFGTVQWVSADSPDAVGKKCREYALTGSQDLVYINGKAMTLLSVMDAGRSKLGGEIKINHHTMDLIDSSQACLPGAFALSPCQKLVALIAAPPTGGKITAETLGTSVPISIWNESQEMSVAILWIMQWKGKGLSPKTPAVVALQEIKIPAKTALKLSKT